jgi:hypothetical protein
MQTHDAAKSNAILAGLRTDTNRHRDWPLQERNAGWYFIDFARGRPTNPARIPVGASAAWYYRVAADFLQHMLPIDAGKDVETLRRHALKIGEALRNDVAAKPETAVQAITVTLDSTFIRSCEEGERHLEVRVGNVETAFGRRQVLGAVAKADTDIKMLIRRSLDAVGRSEETVLGAFTNGCSGLRRILVKAGVTEAPMLDWFHIAMRLQHLEQIAGSLSADDPARVAAKAVIVAEVDRLH